LELQEWEYKWAYWDEAAGRFAQTPIWLTDQEAQREWYAYELDAYRLEYSGRA